MDYLKIEASRDAYGVGDLINRTMTVGELKSFLEDFSDEMPVILSHDNGYTYGTLTSSCFEEDSYEE